MPADESLLNKVAAKIGEPPSYAPDDQQGSILTVAATSYGAKPVEDESTVPTGFDPQAAALFEAVVESAYLVANADGEFDETERQAFKHVVLGACGDKVADNQVSALLADLADELDEDGIDKRIQMVARSIKKPEHATEVLRLAGLIAHVSGGVSEEERAVLRQLQRAFSLGDDALEKALAEVQRALAD